MSFIWLVAMQVVLWPWLVIVLGLEEEEMVCFIWLVASP
jgi:hypothetical protein